MSYLSPDSVRIDDFNYDLPVEMIARFPLENRAGSRLLVYDKGNVGHTNFRNITELEGGGGLMIFNNTKVIQARIQMFKNTGAKIEVFLLEPLCPAEYNLAFSSSSGCRWKCMVGNKKKWRVGNLVRKLIVHGKKATLETRIVNDHGSWQEIEFLWKPVHIPFSLIIDNAGLTPIPPYLDRLPVEIDKSRYQTVYSRFDGSVAAPTAGLHFTDDIMESLKKSGTLSGEITLHVGAGTFQPVKSATAGGHTMHAEHFSVGREIIEQIRDNHGSITAVGTTSVRTLESLYWLGVRELNQGDKHPDKTEKQQDQEEKQLHDSSKQQEQNYKSIEPHQDAAQIKHNTKQMAAGSEQPEPVSKQMYPGERQQYSGGKIRTPMLISQWEHMELPANIPVTEALDAIINKMMQDGLNELEVKTEMMIIPGYRFRMTDRMITNFHLPGSTLLLLIAAFIGDDWRKVYNYALKNKFRFLSYGDSSLLIPSNKNW